MKTSIPIEIHLHEENSLDTHGEDHSNGGHAIYGYVDMQAWMFVEVTVTESGDIVCYQGHILKPNTMTCILDICLQQKPCKFMDFDWLIQTG